MSTATAMAPDTRQEVSFARSAAWAVSDTAMLTWRNLMHYVRVPMLLFYAIIQPIMFTVLFAYVFGGAIDTPTGSYVQFLLPGIIIQTVIFGSMMSGINMAEDMSKGIMDRFRSLPISRGSVLAARTISDTLRNGVSVLIMVAVGYVIGFRFMGTALDAVAAFGLAVLVGLAFSWIAATIGLMVRDAQTAELAGFTWVFPLVFASSIFVPVETMPGWLGAFASVSPISLAANSVRALSLGDAAGVDALWTVAWAAGIILVFGVLATWRFRRLQ